MKCTALRFRGQYCLCRGLGKHVLLVFVEIPADPGHCDDEGEDGEADDEEDFVAHGFEEMFARERWWCEGRGKYSTRSSVMCTRPVTGLGICPAKTWGRDHHARDKAVYFSRESSHFSAPKFNAIPFSKYILSHKGCSSPDVSAIVFEEDFKSEILRSSLFPIATSDPLQLFLVLYNLSSLRCGECNFLHSTCSQISEYASA